MCFGKLNMTSICFVPKSNKIVILTKARNERRGRICIYLESEMQMFRQAQHDRVMVFCIIS
jgi:hypothetical protein